MKEISGVIIDPIGRRKFSGTLVISGGRIVEIRGDTKVKGPFILPGLIDSHIHIESSMLTPAAFASMAATHGTVAVVADPHEIANVFGIGGIDFMIANGEQVPLKFYFGAPSCVPATEFENNGARLSAPLVTELLQREDIHFLAEVMNFPGVINRDPEIMQKIDAAVKMGKRVDGHAPGLSGPNLESYVNAGITSDHEALCLTECLQKLDLGMIIQLRQGSSARNFEDLHPLIKSHTDRCMFCSDDLKPADLVRGHINLMVKRAIELGHDIFDILQCACVNPVQHYGLSTGLLQIHDPADFIMVEELEQMKIISTWINGQEISRDGKALFKIPSATAPNRFQASAIKPADLQIKVQGQTIRVIGVSDGQIVTSDARFRVPNGTEVVETDPGHDLLKIIVLNRYRPAPPALGFVRGFGLRRGAIASSIAHDSHNIIAVGTEDRDLTRAVNLLQECGGGISFVRGPSEKVIKLPVAGLMGTGTCEDMARSYRELEGAVKDNGCSLQTPFMTMSFLALPVIPSLKITDLGLFDVQRFELVGLFV